MTNQVPVAPVLVMMSLGVQAALHVNATLDAPVALVLMVSLGLLVVVEWVAGFAA